MILPLEHVTRPVVELFRFSAERYDDLWQRGLLSSDDRIELLDGQIVRKPDVNPPHLYTLHDLHKRLQQQFEARALVLNQSTIYLPQDGRPDPDITLVRSDVPRMRLPLPEDIHLVIEVADTTLTRDREFKLPLYARDNIQEYWIVNLEENQLEVYREPNGMRYATTLTVRNGMPMACLASPDDLIVWSH
jgi:Uma2 family endonuclease